MCKRQLLAPVPEDTPASRVAQLQEHLYLLMLARRRSRFSGLSPAAEADFQRLLAMRAPLLVPDRDAQQQLRMGPRVERRGSHLEFNRHPDNDDDISIPTVFAEFTLQAEVLLSHPPRYSIFTIIGVPSYTICPCSYHCSVPLLNSP